MTQAGLFEAPLTPGIDVQGISFEAARKIAGSLFYAETGDPLTPSVKFGGGFTRWGWHHWKMEKKGRIKGDDVPAKWLEVSFRHPDGRAIVVKCANHPSAFGVDSLREFIAGVAVVLEKTEAEVVELIRSVTV